MTKLEKARSEINRTDREMAALFCSRMEAVREVAEYKKETGMPIYDESREQELLLKNSSYVDNNELLPYYMSFMENNLKLSRRFQQRLLNGQKIAYSGVPGAFAQIAASRIFPQGNVIPWPDFKSAYQAVVSGECDCAVLPIENSYAGEVAQVMDLAFFGPLCINGIYQLEVNQNLLALPGAGIDEIQKVISHPQALAQCAEYISKKGFESEECANTAVAAQQVAERGCRELAAIASEETAALYGLSVLAREINESSTNLTRFAVFSRVQNQPAAQDNHFIMFFTVNNEAGALSRVTSIIGENGFNLKALRSRPTKKLMWDYYFYAEGEGNPDSENGRKMLEQLKQCTGKVRIIGSFTKETILK